VDSSETAATITVKADYTGDDDVSGTLQIKVITPTEGKVPTVKKVTISADKNTIINNDTDSIELTVTNVVGTNNPNKIVNWSVSEGALTDVKFSPDSGSSTTLKVGTSGVPGKIKVRGESSITSGVFSNEIEITIQSAITSTAIDFTIAANAVKLGLPSTTYTAGPEGSLISAMTGRQSTSFYNQTSGVNVEHNEIYGINGVRRDDIINASVPSMAWIIRQNENTLVSHGWSDIPSYIVFNVAVIKESDGTGWITGNSEDEVSGLQDVYKYSYVGGSSNYNISISTLTEGEITTTAALTGYKVYIIVRIVDAFPTNDFNINAYKDSNVIDITPTSP
jgi:hypothetical protein